MKKLVLVVMVLGMVLSCGRGEVAKEDTEAFVNDFETKNTMLYTNTFQSKGMKIFQSIPQGAIFPKFKKSHLGRYGSYLNIFTYGKSVQVYGTYQWKGTDSGWVLIDSTYPTNGFLFKWIWYDSTLQKDIDVSFLFDSLQIQVVGNDTMPKNIHILLTADTTKLIQGHFDGEYIQVDTFTAPKNVHASITFYGIAQYGIELLNVSWKLNEEGNDIEPTSGKLHFWAIDYQNNNYRIDYTIEMKSETHLVFTGEDSNKWKIFVDVNAVKGDTVVVTLDGEITHINRHAADIDGKIYSPDTYPQKSYVDIIYPDGTKERVYPK